MTARAHGRNILVTGGEGFIGRHVVRLLGETPHRTVVYPHDVRQITEEPERYDVVCHLAGVWSPTPPERDGAESLHLSSSRRDDPLRSAEREVGGWSAQGVDPSQELFDVNVNGTLAVMQYCRTMHAQCILASSAAVYQPTREPETIGEAVRLQPATLYGASKACAEEVCRHFAKEWSVPTIALRIFNPYGPGQQPSFVIPQIAAQLQQGQPIMLRTPLARRDFVFVEDVARAVCAACAYPATEFLALNIGSGQGISVKELALRMATLIGVEPDLQLPARVPSASSVVAEVELAVSTLGWCAKTSIDEGLSRVLHAPAPGRVSFS